MLYFLLIYAGGVYSELGAGGQAIFSGQTYYNNSVSEFPSGMNLNGSLYWNILSELSKFQIHIGGTYRFHTFTSNQITHGQHIPFLGIKIEFSRFTFQGGYSFYGLSTRNQNPLNVLLAQGEWNRLALLGTGVLWKIVPFFYLSLEFTSLWGLDQASPFPYLEASVQMRFYMTEKKNRIDPNRYGDYDGWRYPFGIPIWGK